ncbi:MAG: cold shock domain-containing protein [Fermentimonas sp.]|nr:cold shock domain-containing protein [Fermentimonas sp.]MDD4008700.1 cold shock domain-containing protein [Fermentimonas sp.]MDD4697615.1 cold shock domain-containing protein [Fermentimonas sp.]
MARSNSFSKREIEKNKQQKRKEKQQRREARKLQPSDTFEDMIAYVDANGVITDERPETNLVDQIELEDIEISIPPKEVEEKGEPSGRVDYYDEAKGFGFIKDSYGQNKYFFHKSNAEYGIGENDLVTFRLERGPRGMNAVDVKMLK